MPKLLNIGLYCKNGWQNPTDSVGDRLADLETAIDTAFDTIAPTVPIPVGAPHEYLNIFVAPEYLFKKNDHQCRAHNHISAFDEAEKNTIKDRLLLVSASRTNFLLIGGSVFWAEEVQKKHVWNKKPKGIIRNSVFVANDGNLLLEYNKMNDCGELSKHIPAEGKKYVFERGLTNGLFDCAGLSCGIETCIDHDKGELAKLSDNLDIQFISSNAVTFKNENRAVADDKPVIMANASDKDFGNCIYVHPWAWNSKCAKTSDGQVSFSRFVLP